MRKLLSILFILFACNAYSQINTSISGYVTDETGMALIGASVYLENTTQGAISNENGYYQITKVKPGLSFGGKLFGIQGANSLQY
jgi:hypothetical protein